MKVLYGIFVVLKSVVCAGVRLIYGLLCMSPSVSVKKVLFESLIFFHSQNWWEAIPLLSIEILDNLRLSKCKNHNLYLILLLDLLLRSNLDLVFSGLAYSRVFCYGMDGFMEQCYLGNGSGRYTV